MAVFLPLALFKSYSSYGTDNRTDGHTTENFDDGVDGRTEHDDDGMNDGTGDGTDGQTVDDDGRMGQRTEDDDDGADGQRTLIGSTHNKFSLKNVCNVSFSLSAVHFSNRARMHSFE